MNNTTNCVLNSTSANNASVNCTPALVAQAASARTHPTTLPSSNTYNHTFVIITGIVAGAVVLSLMVTMLAVTWIRQRRYREQVQNYISSGRKTTSVSIQQIREDNGLGKPSTATATTTTTDLPSTPQEMPPHSQDSVVSSSPPLSSPRSFRRHSPPPRVPAVKIAPSLPNPVPKRKMSKNLGLEVPEISAPGRQRTLSSLRRDGKLNSPSSDLYGMK